MDILKQLENAKYQISLVGEDLEHYQDGLDAAINIVKMYKDKKQIDVTENIKQLLKESEKHSNTAAPGYDEGWYNGEMNAYSNILSIIEKTKAKENNISKKDKSNNFRYSEDLYTVTYKDIQGNRYIQQFNTDYELTNFCNHNLSKNINGKIIKLTNTDKITGIIRQTELVLQRDESKNYSQENKTSQDNEKDNYDYERDYERD